VLKNDRNFYKLYFGLQLNGYMQNINYFFKIYLEQELNLYGNHSSVRHTCGRNLYWLNRYVIKIK